MCEIVQAGGPGIGPAIGERLCAEAKRTGVPCHIAKSVPMNDAARRQRRASGLPDHPDDTPQFRAQIARLFGNL